MLERCCFRFIIIINLLGILAQVPLPDVNLSFDCIDNGSVFVSWESPFTLDITGVDNDIEYYIDVSHGNSTRLPSTTSVQTNFTAILPDSDSANLSCIPFEIIITPYNDYGNGTSTSVETNPNQGSKLLRMIVARHFSIHFIVWYSNSFFPISLVRSNLKVHRSKC